VNLLPTEKKQQSVAEIRRLLEGSTVTISADYTGMSVSAMTELRRVLRDAGVEFHVVKNRLTYLAADEASKPLVKEIVQGPTGMAFGFDDPVAPAKALVDYIRANRSPLTIKGAVLGDRQLNPEEVSALAVLPSKEELIARLAAQIQAPIARLANVLNAPLSGLVTVLQRASEAPSETPAEA
jgi:large subunit ribosomal protein L10